MSYGELASHDDYVTEKTLRTQFVSIIAMKLIEITLVKSIFHVVLPWPAKQVCLFFTIIISSPKNTFVVP